MGMDSPSFGFYFHNISNISRLCTKYNFEKPNDERALGLMNFAAVYVMETFSDIIFAYGQSDEYSFLLQKSAKCFQRRTR